MIRGLFGTIALIGLVMCLNEQPDGVAQEWWINVLGMFLFGGGAGVLIVMDIEE